MMWVQNIKPANCQVLNVVDERDQYMELMYGVLHQLNEEAFHSF